ncbi:MAG: tetratricopeptide repeat protein [Deltaproteobacteria bacterium]|nr:tetratricopeptide repeat protein [Deltaproteobacteria bacterium]
MDQPWWHDGNGKGAPLAEEKALRKEIAVLEDVISRQVPVMVVDQQENMRLFLAGALKAAGFKTILRASDSNQAYRLARDEMCGLMVVDWQPPRVDGLELLDRVRNDPHLAPLVFIMVVGDDLDQRILLAAEEKQDAFLTKPFSTDAMVRLITSVLERRLTTARSRLWEILGQVDRAVDEFMVAAQKNPNARWPYFGLGSLMTRHRRLAEAERCYQKILNLEKKSAAAMVELGRLAERRRDVMGARLWFDRAIDAKPMYLKAYDALAESYMAEGLWDAGVEVLDRAVKKWGAPYAERHEQLGRLNYILGNYAEAAEAFREAVRLRPRQKDWGLYMALARCYLGAEQAHRAVDALEEAAFTAREPDKVAERAKALLVLTEAHIHFGQFDLAEGVVEKMSQPQTWPGVSLPFPLHRLYREVGGAYLREHRPQEAVRYLALSLMIDSSDQDNRERVRRLCLDTGYKELLPQVVAAARQQRAAEVEVFTRRGLDFTGQGRFELALDMYAKALLIDPAAGRVHFNMGKLYYRLGYQEDSFNALATAYEEGLAARDWELVTAVVGLVASQGHLPEAEDLLTNALKADPQNPQLSLMWNRLFGGGEEPPPAPGEPRDPSLD